MLISLTRVLRRKNTVLGYGEQNKKNKKKNKHVHGLVMVHDIEPILHPTEKNKTDARKQCYTYGRYMYMSLDAAFNKKRQWSAWWIDNWKEITRSRLFVRLSTVFSVLYFPLHCLTIRWLIFFFPRGAR